MKVLCIDASGLSDEFGFVIVENEVYEVLDHEVNLLGEFYLIHITLYVLFYYHTFRFVPISDIDETERVNLELQESIAV